MNFVTKIERKILQRVFDKSCGAQKKKIGHKNILCIGCYHAKTKMFVILHVAAILLQPKK